MQSFLTSIIVVCVVALLIMIPTLIHIRNKNLWKCMVANNTQRYSSLGELVNVDKLVQGNLYLVSIAKYGLTYTRECIYISSHSTEHLDVDEYGFDIENSGLVETDYLFMDRLLQQSVVLDKYKNAHSFNDISINGNGTWWINNLAKPIGGETK